MIHEAPNPTKRLRRLRARLPLDPALSKLVASIRQLVKQEDVKPYKLRDAMDLVIQEMRVAQYRQALLEASCGGSSEPGEQSSS